MNRSNLSKPKREGFSVVAVLLGLVALLSIGGGLLSLGLHSRIQTVRECQQIEARCAADAGMEKAISMANKMLEAKAWYDNALPFAENEVLPNCDATFSYKIGSTSGSREFTIVSIGRSGPTLRQVYATLQLQGLFESAIVTQDRISLMPNTLVTGYNSADPKDTDIDVKIGTTSILADRIPLGPGTVVDGDVFVGVDGDPAVVIGAGGTIKGEKYALPEEIEFPIITPPALPDMGTSLDAKGEPITIRPAQSGTYGGISLAQAGGNDGILEISGGNVTLHIAGDIAVGTGCEIVVRPGSSLNLYVDGNIDASNSAGFNNEAGHVADFKLYATGEGKQTFDLKAKSSMFGAVYAPNADITLYPSSEMHGSIVGSNVVFKSGGTFFYDEALREVNPNDEGVRIVMKQWSEQ